MGAADAVWVSRLVWRAPAVCGGSTLETVPDCMLVQVRC